MRASWYLEKGLRWLTDAGSRTYTRVFPRRAGKAVARVARRRISSGLAFEAIAIERATPRQTRTGFASGTIEVGRAVVLGYAGQTALVRPRS